MVHFPKTLQLIVYLSGVEKEGKSPQYALAEERH